MLHRAASLASGELDEAFIDAFNKSELEPPEAQKPVCQYINEVSRFESVWRNTSLEERPDRWFSPADRMRSADRSGEGGGYRNGGFGFRLLRTLSSEDRSD